MADDVQVSITAVIDQFVGAMHQVGEQVEGLAAPIKHISSAAVEMGEALAAAFAAEKVAEFVEKMTELAVRTERTMALLGVSAQTVATLDVASKSAGTSLESVTHALERLGLGLARADAGSEQVKAGLAALGVSAKDFAGLNTEEKLELLADKFSVLKDGVEKDAIAMAILGRAGAEMIPLFNQGSAAMEEFAEMVKRAGSEATPEFLAAAHKLHEQGIELGQSWQGLGQTILTILQPALSGVVKIATDLVQNFNNAMREGGLLRDIVDLLAASFKIVATAIAAVIVAVESLWTIAVTALDTIILGVQGLARALYALAHLDFDGVKTAFRVMATDITARMRQSTEQIEKYGRDLVGQLHTIWSSGAADHEKIEQTKTAKLAIVNRDAVAAAMEAEQQKRKAAELTYQQAVERANTDEKLHNTTETQKTNTLLAALEVRRAAEMASIDRELAIHGLSLAQHQKLLNEKLTLDQKYYGDRQKIVDQAMLAEQKNWNSAFTAVQGSFNSQLRGLLAGTTSFAQASKAMLGDLVIKAIEMIEKWTFEWAAGQLAQLVVQRTTDAGKVASAQAAQTAALPTKVAAFLSDLNARAALVFAGVFANLSPALGPGAAGPAAAAQASVIAAGVPATPQFAVGTDMILRSGLAQVHEGEMIRPAQGSGPYTGANENGGGDTHHHWNVSAWDAASVAAWLKRGGKEMLAAHVADAYERNPSLRPAY